MGNSSAVARTSRVPAGRSHSRRTGTTGRSAERHRRGEQNAAGQSETVRHVHAEEKRMTGRACGNDGLWTVRKTKSRFSLTAHEPLEIANRAISTFPQPRLANAMEKWKSKSRIPTFPRRFPLSQKPKTKGDQSRPVTLVFRLISGLENAGRGSNHYIDEL